MANVGVGGLYASVGLDISGALGQLKVLDRELKRVFTTTQTRGGRSSNILLNPSAASATTKNLTKTTAATAALGAAAAKTSKDTAALSGSLKGVGNSLSTTLASFGAARSGNYFYALSSGLQAVTRGMGGAAAATSVATKALTAIAIAAAAAVLAIGGVAVGLKKILSVSNRSAATLETLSVSFEALLGSSARAKEELDFLVSAAKISPYFTEAIISLDRFLLAQGLLNDQLRRGITQRLIDFGAAAGLTGDKLQDLAYALGQVYNAGRLTGDEARQLRNNFLGAQNVLRSLPRYAELSGAALADAMEKGTITSEDFFEAFFAYTERFGEAAAAQAQTLRGLKDTFVDVFQLGLGQAQIDIAGFNRVLAPIENLKATFRELLDIFNQIDFRPLVASFGALVNTFVGPFLSFLRRESESIIFFFQDRLPRAILFTANLFRAFSVTIALIGRVIRLSFQLLRDTFLNLVGVVTGGSIASGESLKFIGRAALIVAVPVILFFTKWALAIGTVIVLAQTLIALFTGGLKAAGQTFINGMLGITKFLGRVGGGFVDAWNALNNLKPLDFDKLLPDRSSDLAEFQRMMGLAPSGAGGELFPPSGGDADKKASAAAKAMDKAMNTLFDLTRRWFGLRSELEQALFGEEGFEATISSIASMSQKLIEALRDIAGAEGVARQVESATLQLLALARKREEAAEALAKAERKLEEAIRSRDSFAAKVRESAIEFANAFKLETETVREFQLFSERGFFFETEKKKQKDFVSSLKERLEALKNFLKNIKILRDRGLDKGLLEQLLAAGPEQAGEVAAELAKGGDAIIGEVNVLQAAVTQVADELGQFGAQEFYQAGVDMAQAEVDGLKSQLASISAAAQSLVQIILEAVLPFAKQMEDAGAAGGSGLADGLLAGTSTIGEILNGLNLDVDNSLDLMKDNFGSLPGAFAGGLLAGESTMSDAVDSFFGGIQTQMDEWFGGPIKSSWDGGLMQMWADFTTWASEVFYPAWSGFWNAVGNVVATLWNNLLKSVALVANGVVSIVERFVNAFITGINTIIRSYNAIPGLPNLNEISTISLGRLDLSGYEFHPGTVFTDPGTYNFDQPTRGPFNGDVKVDVWIGPDKLTDIVDTRVAFQASEDVRYTVGRKR